MPLLEVSGTTKRFPGVVALKDARLSVAAGEVHALLGENGAGKSTLLKILAGAQAADEGEIRFDGCPLDPADTPAARQALGIVTIYQEFNLLPAMSVAENMYLGREPRRFGLIDWAAMRRRAAAVLAELGLDLDPRTEVRRLSVADQQMVEIARAMTLNARLIIMDEPTAALSDREVAKLHALVAGLRGRGVGIVYVTHRLREVTAICDRYTVMRDGAFVATGAVRDASVDDMVRLMVGRDVAAVSRPRRSGGETMLRVRGVSRRRGSNEARGTSLAGIDLDVRRGEILGLAGLVGAGRTELARLIFAADRMDAGELWLDGRGLAPLRTPRDAVRAGIMLVPEDRKQQGCFLSHSIRHNMTLPSLPALSRGGFVDERAEAALVARYRQALGIRMASDAAAIGTLSGGNQQKVLLARAMALRPKVLIVDEPTRGIDVGAKAEVHQVLFDLAAAGVAVIVISSELPEIMAVSDRITVFREGRIAGTLDNDDVGEQVLMALMAAGPAAHAA